MNIIKLHALPPSDFIGNSIFSNPVPTNTPFLADKDSGKVIEPVLHFILAQTKVSNSNEARCDDLKDWFIYLDAFELNWLDANDEDLDQYQEIMENKHNFSHDGKAIIFKLHGDIEEHDNAFNFAGIFPISSYSANISSRTTRCSMWE